MRLFIAILISFSAFPIFANTTHLPARPVVGINAHELTKRVCYYQDQAYSQGAILQVGKHYMTCQSANEYETNGALAWVKLEKTQIEQPVEPSSQSQKRYSVK